MMELRVVMELMELKLRGGGKGIGVHQFHQEVSIPSLQLPASCAGPSMVEAPATSGFNSISFHHDPQFHHFRTPTPNALPA